MPFLKLNDLNVISRTSSFCYKNKTASVKDIVNNLNVSLILEGNLRIHNQRIKISIRLIDALEDIHLWSESWEDAIDTIFDTQDKISLVIADKLREHIGHFEISDQLIKQQTNNLEAYEYYLKG